MSNNQLSVRPVKAKSARSRSKAAHALATKPVMLVVLGMHRSGTSVCARMLECLGATPSKRLIVGDPDNPKGFFEDFAINSFNESNMLPPLQRTWHSTAPVDWSLLSDADRSRLALAAVQIVRDSFSASNSLSVLKEPRIGILLPFWLSVLSHAGYEVRVVCALRDPVSVARSLWKRDKFTTAHSGLLYLSYWLSILNCLRSLPVAFVQFDEVLSHPKDVLQRVARKLVLQQPPDFAKRVEEFREDFLTRDLRHHRFHIRDLDLEPEMPPLTLELYRNLLRAAQGQNLAPLLKFAAATEKELALLHPVLVEFDRAHGAFWNEQARASQLQARVTALETEATQHQASDFAQERGALAEQITRLQNEKDELAARASSLESEHLSLVAERDDLASCNQQLATASESLRIELLADLERTTADRDSLRDQIVSLGATVQNLQAQALERGALAERITLLEKEKLAHNTERTQLLADLERTTADRDKFASACNKLESNSFVLDREKQMLTASIAERFKEVAAMTRELIKVREELNTTAYSLRLLERTNALLRNCGNRLRADYNAITASLEWRIGSYVGILFGPLRFRSRRRRKLQMECRLLIASRYFDPTCYHNSNPDVAQSRMHAAEHFLLHGASESRKPSEDFDVADYLVANPDIADSPDGINPLIHYIRFGEREGRRLVKPT